jgi:SLOG-like protein
MIAPIFLSASEPNPERDRRYWPGNLLHVREAVRTFCAHILPHYPLVYGGHPAITPMVNQIAARMSLLAAEEEEDAETREGRPQDQKSSPPPKILMFRSDLYIYPPNDREDVFVTPENMVVTPAHESGGERATAPGGQRNASLLRMRYEMLGRPGPYPVHRDFGNMADQLGRIRRQEMGTYEFSAAVFIGGMEGVEHEFNIFRSFHPTTPAYPIASTGSACTDLFERVRPFLMPTQSQQLAEGAAYSLLMQSLFPIPSAGSEVAKEGPRWPPDPTAQNTKLHIDPESVDKPRPPPPTAPQPKAA